MSLDAMKQALEALEQLQGGCTDSDDGTVEAITVWCPEVITALRAAIEQAEKQEPVAVVEYMNTGGNAGIATRIVEIDDPRRERLRAGDKLFTAPPPRQWQGLTDEERKSIREWQRIQEELGPVWAPMMLYLYEAIEAKLKEKNT